MNRTSLGSIAAFWLIALSSAPALACGNVMLSNYIPSTDLWAFTAPLAFICILIAQRFKPAEKQLQYAIFFGFSLVPNIVLFASGIEPKMILLGINLQGLFGLFFYALTLVKIIERPREEQPEAFRGYYNGLMTVFILVMAIAIGVTLETLEPTSPEFSPKDYGRFTEADHSVPTDVTF